MVSRRVWNAYLISEYCTRARTAMFQFCELLHILHILANMKQEESKSANSNREIHITGWDEKSGRTLDDWNFQIEADHHISQTKHNPPLDYRLTQTPVPNAIWKLVIGSLHMMWFKFSNRNASYFPLGLQLYNTPTTFRKPMFIYTGTKGWGAYTECKTATN